MSLRLILLFMLICAIGYGQARSPQKARKKPYLKHSWQWLNKYYKSSWDDCISTKTYSLQQRLNHYPYNKASKILAISYHNVEGYPNEEVRIDTVTGKTIPQKPIDTLQFCLRVKDGQLIPNSIVETVELSQKQIDKLTGIVYNTAYRTKTRYMADPGGKCYIPRNALLFLDAHGKIFDYLEVCFECHNYSSKSDKLSIGNLCNQKYDLMKQWFINVGLKYGTINTD